MTVYLYNADAEFKVPIEFFTFPGGEPHVKVNDSLSYRQHYVIIGLVSSMKDMGYIMVLNDYLRRNHVEKVSLYIPYLPGARQDRGEPLTAKIYADMINAMNFNRVISVDVHSDVMPALMNNFYSIPQVEFFGKAVKPFLTDNTVLVAPDAGAIKKTEAIAAHYGYPMVVARKKRDFLTGNLSGFECEEIPNYHDVMVVDDICDGGGTFVGLADVMRYTSGMPIPVACKTLFVTHGIFSKGIGKLKDYYENIVSTDSFSPKHYGTKWYLNHSTTKVSVRIDHYIYSLEYLFLEYL